MILLEFASRVCKKDSTPGDLTDALGAIEHRYFTKLPGVCGEPSDFKLPGEDPKSQLLGLMFDAIRNGKAHQYNAPKLKLLDGEVIISLTGAQVGLELERPGRVRPVAEHLSYKTLRPNDLCLHVRTDQLFLDFKQAIETSKIISNNPDDLVEDVVRPDLGWATRKRKSGVKIIWH